MLQFKSAEIIFPNTCIFYCSYLLVIGVIMKTRGPFKFGGPEREKQKKLFLNHVETNSKNLKLIYLVLLTFLLETGTLLRLKSVSLVDFSKKDERLHWTCYNFGINIKNI